MSDPTNTPRSFADKWNKNADCAFKQTITEGTDIYNWILSRNGFENASDFSNYLISKHRILDAGCGNGRVTALLRMLSNASTTEIVGIDLVAAEVARINLKDTANVQFFQKDLLGDLDDLGKFDFIYCQEVLHHTSDPERAFANLCRLLSDDGEIAIYVYKQKAPVREFVDDFVREKIAGLSYKEAYKACEQITDLGKMLSDLQVTFKAPDVEVLGIEAGEYDIQRFIYHFFMKCFWNDELSRNENVVINYDWYHPQLCSRHILEEVRGWFAKNRLSIIHESVDHYGITIRGMRTK